MKGGMKKMLRTGLQIPSGMKWVRHEGRHEKNVADGIANPVRHGSGMKNPVRHGSRRSLISPGTEQLFARGSK